MKKTVALLLVCSVLFGTTLTGCTKNATNKETSKNEVGRKDQNPNVNPAGVFPIAKEKIALKVAIKQSPDVMDYDTNEFTKWIEEKTNIDLQFEMLPNKDTATKVNLLMASGKDLPDIMMGTGVDMSTLYTYALDKLVIPLNDYIDTYGVEFRNMISAAANKQLENSLKTPDGKIYALPKYNESIINMYSTSKVWIYKPWLDKLGLRVPTTIEEFYSVLKEFKTKDPNGNGKADEIPFAGANGGWYTSPVTPIMNAFTPDENKAHMYIRDGKIEVSYIKPEFKEGLKALNKFTSEKLLDPISFTQDLQQLQNIANKNEVILGSFVAGAPPVNRNSPRVFDYVPVPVLKGPTGKGGAVAESGLPAGDGAFFITSSCKNPEAAYRLGDLLLSEEATLFARYGVPGKDWKKAEPTELGVDGTAAYIKILNPIWGTVQNSHWAVTHATNLPYSKSRQALQPGERSVDSYQYEIVTKFIKPYVVATQLPPLSFTKEEARDYNTLSATIKEHVDTNIAAFATGNRNVDKEWDKFQEELKGLGIDNYLKMTQTAYDRQYKK